MAQQSDIQVDKHYDIIIIGAGSGNMIPNHRFDNKSIAIVEKGRFGGTCLNVGCIPTKMFVYAADVADTVRSSGKYGVDSTLDSVDWPGIVSRVFDKRIDPIAQGGEAYRRGPETPNIDVYDQHARFVGERTISTGDGDQKKIISADQIIIAAGARPHILPVIEQSGVPYYTNENVLRLPQLPQTMIILGGGFIAVEFAHIFSALGVDVTVVNRSPRLLKHLDEQVSDRFTELASERWNTRLGHEVAAAEENSNGSVTITLDNGEKLTADVLVSATGRTPNGDQMDLDKGGVEMDGQRIKVDEYGRTTASGVWAFGDVSSPFQLKHVANAEARVIEHNVLNPDDLRAFPHKHVPAAIFTNPQIGYVGMTEQQARDAGHAVTVKVQDYSDVAYGWAMENTTGFAKLIADKDTGKLLGAFIIGPQASTLIQQLVTMMAFDIDVRAMAADQYWIHPALPELIENALLGLEF